MVGGARYGESRRDEEDSTAHPGTPSFGLDDFGLDDRMRLFGYVTAENRLAYLWVLRAFNAARASYHVVLHTSEVATTLARLAAAHPDCPDPAVLDLPRLLDAATTAGPLLGSPVATPWDPRLASAMCGTGRAVMEERLLDELLRDLHAVRAASAEPDL